MATSEEIFRDAMTLPPDARAELTERLVESLAQEISPEITSAQLAEVRRRIAQVESGEAELILGDEALARTKSVSATPAKRRRREILRAVGATTRSLPLPVLTPLTHPLRAPGVSDSKGGLDGWINQTVKDFVHALRRVRHARIKPPFQQSKKFAR